MASSAHNARWIREEAVMAAITFNAAHQKVHIREQLKTVLAAFREMLDAFASNWMRQAAAEAEHARPRQIGDRSSQPINAQ
jgi:hypothetical protein